MAALRACQNFMKDKLSAFVYLSFQFRRGLLLALTASPLTGFLGYNSIPPQGGKEKNSTIKLRVLTLILINNSCRKFRIDQYIFDP